jgi:hypothetical protein
MAMTPAKVCPVSVVNRDMAVSAMRGLLSRPYRRDPRAARHHADRIA